jgi:PKD repeat protein
VTNTVTVSTGCPNLTVSIEWAHGGGTSTVSTTLMSPTGQAITAATQAADVEHDSDPTWESYDISFPETGVWTIISTGVSVEPGGGTVGVNAEALPPIAPAVLAFATPSSGNPPLTVTFTAAAALEGGTITSYVWNFGDGTAGSGATATHRYTADGTYVATLTVTSSEGERASSTTSQIVVG